MNILRFTRHNIVWNNRIFRSNHIIDGLVERSWPNKIHNIDIETCGLISRLVEINKISNIIFAWVGSYAYWFNRFDEYRTISVFIDLKKTEIQNLYWYLSKKKKIYIVRKMFYYIFLQNYFWRVVLKCNYCINLYFFFFLAFHLKLFAAHKWRNAVFDSFHDSPTTFANAIREPTALHGNNLFSNSVEFTCTLLVE